MHYASALETGTEQSDGVPSHNTPSYGVHTYPIEHCGAGDEIELRKPFWVKAETRPARYWITREARAKAPTPKFFSLQLVSLRLTPSVLQPPFSYPLLRRTSASLEAKTCAAMQQQQDGGRERDDWAPIKQPWREPCSLVSAGSTNFSHTKRSSNDYASNGPPTDAPPGENLLNRTLFFMAFAQIQTHQCPAWSSKHADRSSDTQTEACQSNLFPHPRSLVR